MTSAMTSTLSARQILPPFSLAAAIVAVSGSAYGLYNPLGWSAALGVPYRGPHSATASSSSSSSVSSLLRLVAVRNVGSGIVTLVLLGLGETRAAGISFIAGVVAAWGNAYVCWMQSREAEGESAAESNKKAFQHLLGGATVAALGWALAGV